MREVTNLRMRVRPEAEVLAAAIEAGATWTGPRDSASGLPEATLADGTLVALVTGFGWFLNEAFLAHGGRVAATDHQPTPKEH
jgi:hypothetical protein